MAGGAPAGSGDGTRAETEGTGGAGDRSGPAGRGSSRAEHHARAAAEGPVPVGIVTVSDTRTADTDVNGAYLRAAVMEAGHVVAGYRVVRDEPAEVVAALAALVDLGARVVVFNGGTGIARRDTTSDVLDGLYEKRLPGFGELFRLLSWEQVGAAAMLSRASAGVHRGAVVFSTPGSPQAVRLAWERLIAPELAHVGWELGRG